jgi:hypothetical protein
MRPDIIVVTEGQVKFRDLSDLLPLPVPVDAPIRATLYTAPELIVNAAGADARADLYSFGATIYALFMGRELVEKDFERQGMPKPFIPQFPDCHPAFGRLISKTFWRDLGYRFPSDEAARQDKTGFTELIHTLENVGKALDTTRLEVCAWTTTGMIRTGNEDAFAFLRSSRADDASDCALVLLADGMGGYEAGEVAAAAGDSDAQQSRSAEAVPLPGGGTAYPIEGRKGAQDVASRSGGADEEDPPRRPRRPTHGLHLVAQGVGRRGMGCTAEAVWVDGRTLSPATSAIAGRITSTRAAQTAHARPDPGEPPGGAGSVDGRGGGEPSAERVVAGHRRTADGGAGRLCGDAEPGRLIVVCPMASRTTSRTPNWRR